MMASVKSLIGVVIASVTLMGMALHQTGTRSYATSGTNSATQEVPRSGYVRANDLNMYYEVHGTGDPLVLIHGSFLTIELNWGAMIPELSRGRSIIAVELEGHGHTEALDRPLSHQQMADDTAALLRALDISRADVLGYSLGGTVAIEMAIRHPELVRKLIVVSAPFDRAGWYPEVYAAVEQVSPELLAGSGLPETYSAVAPNPAGFPALVGKVQAMTSGWTGRTPDEFRSIAAPTLIIVGDSDGVPLEKVVEMFKLRGGGVFGDVAGLPSSQLAILPGTTHFGLMMQSQLLLPIVTAFLDAQ
jgi:pimeloyl-ACP methyl ester carboxylesterase